MDWGDVPWGALVTLLLAWTTVVLVALREYFGRTFASRKSVCLPDGRPRFVTHDEANGITRRIDEREAALDRKIERNTGLFIALDDRTGDLEEKVTRLEERQTQQWERIGERMAETARTNKDTAEKLEQMGERMQDLMLRLERIDTRKGD